MAPNLDASLSTCNKPKVACRKKLLAGKNYIILFQVCRLYAWASKREDLSSVLANNKDIDQLAHPRRLISAFIIRFLESSIYKRTTGKVSIV